MFIKLGFNEHINKDKKILYHYTNIDSLFSIINSKKIWLSCPYYLNDKSEILYGIELIGRLLDQIEIETNVREKLKSSINEFRRVHYVFVFSLSKHENLLSQWRGYTKINTGVCIGFSEDKLLNRARQNGIDLFECIYDQNKQRDKLEEIAKMISENFSKGEKGITNREELIKLLCTIKNYLFHEEGEYRLVSNELFHSPKINYRIINKYIAPYIELDIAGLEGGDFLFDEVIIGPCDDKNLSFESISNFIMVTNASCKVMYSGQTLRE